MMAKALVRANMCHGKSPLPATGVSTHTCRPRSGCGILGRVIYLPTGPDPEGGSGVPTLQLYMLGALEIQYNGQQLPKPPTLKSQSLLAYAVLHRDRPQPRDRLVGLYWGDRAEDKARRSLRTALWHIRRCLPEGSIRSDPHTVQFDPQGDVWLDVDEFESLVAHDDIASLQAAVALYRGDFLDGFYDDWIINERYRLESLATEARARLMLAQEARGEHQVALGTALRLLDHDPRRGDAHRLAMRAYCRLGQRNAALEQHRR